MENNNKNKEINNLNESQDKNTPSKQKEPLMDRIEDTMDDIVGSTQEFFYGKGDNFTEDIPAMMEHPSGIKRINKVQTRRNLNKRLFKNKTFRTVLLIIFLIPLSITLLTFIISLFM